MWFLTGNVWRASGTSHCAHSIPVLLPLLTRSPSQPSTAFREFLISSRQKTRQCKMLWHSQRSSKEQEFHLQVWENTASDGKRYLWKNVNVQMELDLLNYRLTLTCIACLWSFLKSFLQVWWLHVFLYCYQRNCLVNNITIKNTDHEDF